MKSQKEKKDKRTAKDGLVLMYVKDKMVYQVVLNKKEWLLLQHVGNEISSPLKVLDHPIGEAVIEGYEDE